MSVVRDKRLRPLLTGAAVLLAAASATGCGGSAKVRPASFSEPVVAVGERDFHIQAPAHLKAGRVDLRVHNEGPDQHELIIVPARPGGLPLRRDGLTVDEESIEQSEPGALEPGEPGAVRDLDVTLAPGRYVFFCNMEGHYLGGMHTEVVVTR